MLFKTYLLQVSAIHFYIVVNLSSGPLLGMLVWPFWRIGRQIDKNTDYLSEYEANSPRPIQKLMRAIVESGAVYSTAGLVTFLVSASGSNATYVTADMVSILACI